MPFSQLAKGGEWAWAPVSYISTGSGALLEFMEGKELPGVAALPASA